MTIVGDGSVTIASGAPIATGGGVMIEAGAAAGAVSAGSGFVNDDGVNAFNVSGDGTWRVYSQDPRDNALGGLTSANYSFVQYAAPNAYGAPGAATTFADANAALNEAASGNGFLYAVSPTVTATVTTSFTKVYDATTALPGAGSIPISYGAPVVTVGGAAVTNLGAGGTADAVTLNQAASLSLSAANFYPDKDVGTYAVGVPGVSLQSAKDANGVTVYGYTVTPSAAGTATITPKPLSVADLLASNKVYDGTTADTLAGSASLLASEAPGTGATTDGAPYSGDSVALTGTRDRDFQPEGCRNRSGGLGHWPVAHRQRRGGLYPDASGWPYGGHHRQGANDHRPRGHQQGVRCDDRRRAERDSEPGGDGNGRRGQHVRRRAL